MVRVRQAPALSEQAATVGHRRPIVPRAREETRIATPQRRLLQHRPQAAPSKGKRLARTSMKTYFGTRLLRPARRFPLGLLTVRQKACLRGPGAAGPAFAMDNPS